MQCQQCQTPLEAGAEICNSCGAFTNSRVERLIEDIMLATVVASPEAQVKLEQALGLVSPQNQPYLRQRVRAKVQEFNPDVDELDQTMVGELALDAEQTMVNMSPLAKMTSEAPPPLPPAKFPAPQSPPRQVSEPAYRPQPPTGKKASQTIFMDFNQAPREILRVMDEAQQNAATFNQQRKRWGRIFWLLLPAGIPFFCADFALGYNILTFSLVAITLWAAAIVGLIIRWRQGRPPKFGPQFDVTRSIFEIIKDDVSPQKTLIGWLDLTGAEQESKATRQKNSRSGQPIVYYRDEWLRLKASLFDGNVLRMSLIDRVKARQGYWKRSRISGKNKWKSGSSQSRYQLQFSVSVNTDLYQVQPIQSGSPAPNSRFTIMQADAADGRLSIKAETDETFDAWDVLNVMRFGYDHLKAIHQ